MFADCQNGVLSDLMAMRVRLEIIIVIRLLLGTRQLGQTFLTGGTLERSWSAHFEILHTVLVCDVDFLCNEDGIPVCDHGRPEDGHGCAQDGEVDLQAGDNEDFRVPPGEVEASDGI